MANKQINQYSNAVEGSLADTDSFLLQDGANVTKRTLLSTLRSLFRKFTDNIILPSAQGKGILLDVASPNYGWRDVIGHFYPDPAGPDAPVLTTWRGTARRHAYKDNDKLDTEIHILHDALVGRDGYVHFHWGHNGTAITGDLVLTVTIDHTPGHRRAGGSSITKVITIPSANLAQYACDITDVLILKNGGGAGLIDSANVLPDDSLLISLVVTSRPVVTGGTSSRVFIWNADLHTETTGVIGSKNKSPTFWS